MSSYPRAKDSTVNIKPSGSMAPSACVRLQADWFQAQTFSQTRMNIAYSEWSADHKPEPQQARAAIAALLNAHRVTRHRPTAGSLWRSRPACTRCSYLHGLLLLFWPTQKREEMQAITVSINMTQVSQPEPPIVPKLERLPDRFVQPLLPQINLPRAFADCNLGRAAVTADTGKGCAGYARRVYQSAAVRCRVSQQSRTGLSQHVAPPAQVGIGAVACARQYQRRTVGDPIGQVFRLRPAG